MTTDQKRKVLIRIQEIEVELSQLKDARQKLVSGGYASASISSGGGSRSYTAMDVSKISETIADLVEELKQLRAMLGGSPSRAFEIGQMYTVYM